MKNKSNTAFPTIPQPWKIGEWAIYINHKDNGEQPEEQEGNRYEADFTIVKELSAEAAIKAFTRQQEDPELDACVIHTIEVEGKYALDVEREYANLAPMELFPEIPNGKVKKGEIYRYDNGVVMVKEDHDAGIDPELNATKYNFYRKNKGRWIPGEKIGQGEGRIYEEKEYDCLKEHESKEDNAPDKAKDIWKEK